MESKRPTIEDAAVTVAEKFLDRFIDWCAYQDEPVETERTRLKLILMETFKRYGLDDGYVIARQLEDDYMAEADEALVDLMADVREEMQSSVDKLTNEWVKANGLIPEFQLGKNVSAKWGLLTVNGSIAEIRADVARYGISVPGVDGICVVPFEAVQEP